MIFKIPITLCLNFPLECWDPLFLPDDSRSLRATGFALRFSDKAGFLSS
jgi:hypothetical protein